MISLAPPVFAEGFNGRSLSVSGPLKSLMGLLRKASVASAIFFFFFFFASQLQGLLQITKFDQCQLHMQAFRYSINYLMLLFAALLLDHYVLIRP
mgnify:CR=1 FL=1